jgi:hypothetical protein
MSKRNTTTSKDVAQNTDYQMLIIFFLDFPMISFSFRESSTGEGKGGAS